MTKPPSTIHRLVHLLWPLPSVDRWIANKRLAELRHQAEDNPTLARCITLLAEANARIEALQAEKAAACRTAATFERLAENPHRAELDRHHARNAAHTFSLRPPPHPDQLMVAAHAALPVYKDARRSAAVSVHLLNPLRAALAPIFPDDKDINP